ncbi:MAG: NAD-binding protein [Chloroflexi bacterium]|nr:NAD-binding protein [Chloroflexota bacterium]
MDSLNTTQRQVRAALVAIALVIFIGVIGFTIIERLTFMDALWVTVVTLATIGYGDVVPHTPQGRLFTIFLIIVGLSVFAYGLQATATLIVSPNLREARQRRRIHRAVGQLQHHYVILGAGELVDKTINLLLDSAQRRQAAQLARLYQPVDRALTRFLGDEHQGRLRLVRRWLARVAHGVVRQMHRGETLLDVVVVVTPSPDFANHLREHSLLVIEGDPSSDSVLRSAGIERAQALMVLLDSDTETLLAVLTARALNSNLDITAAALEEMLVPKMLRAGANAIIAPYDIAGQFLNNATLRPAVNDFFGQILFSSQADVQTTALHLGDDSPWIGYPLGSLDLRDQFQAAVLGLRLESGDYLYTPDENRRLQENEALIVVAPAPQIALLQAACRGGRPPKPRQYHWQRLPQPSVHQYDRHPTPDAHKPVEAMSRHFIICGSGRVARNAINKLNPQRPFVIISDNAAYADELRERGFRVVYGDPTAEPVLRQAGVERALAIMVAVDDPAASVLTVLNCRVMSKRLLITAAAPNDDMITRLQRAGADRVVGSFQAAAAYVLLAATRPAVSEFLQHILFNPQVGIETTELYMQDNSPWIGWTINALHLRQRYRAGVIGLRLADGRYRYAPPGDHVLGENEVLIVVTPMEFSDELRETAHGSETKRPDTLRRL